MHPKRAPAALVLALALAACVPSGDAPEPRTEGHRLAANTEGAGLAPSDTSCTLGERMPDVLPAHTLESIRQELPARQVVECALGPDAPPARLVVEADTADDVLTALTVTVDGRAPQRLEPLVDGDPPPRWTPYLYVVDVDADGWRDLELLLWWGATGNRGYAVWRYDPASGRFESDSLLQGVSNPEPVPGRPCLRSRSTGGMAGMIYGRELLCREGDGAEARWVVAERESQTWNEGRRAFVRERRVRRGDSLDLVRTDTVRPPRPAER